MTLKLNGLILLSLLFLLQACGGKDSARVEASIVRDFISTPSAAVEKYKNIWAGYRSDDISYERFVIASELMDHDPVEYEEYYNYVKRNLKKENGEYRLRAIRALRKAKGIESLGFLFEAYGSGQDMAARAAADVIKIRYQKVKGVAELHVEKDFIEERNNGLRKQGRAPTTT